MIHILRFQDLKNRKHSHLGVQHFFERFATTRDEICANLVIRLDSGWSGLSALYISSEIKLSLPPQFTGKQPL